MDGFKLKMKKRLAKRLCCADASFVKYRGVVKAKISRETLMTTLRELATLRQSGMQLDECLESLIETTSDSHLAVALETNEVGYIIWFICMTLS